jgi:hypothetical protein
MLQEVNQELAWWFALKKVTAGEIDYTTEGANGSRFCGGR